MTAGLAVLMAMALWGQQPVPKEKYTFAMTVVQALKEGNTELAAFIDPQAKPGSEQRIMESLLNVIDRLKAQGNPAELIPLNVLEYTDDNNGEKVWLIPLLWHNKIISLKLFRPVHYKGTWYLGGPVQLVNAAKEKKLTKGYQLYMAKCFSCHGKYGEGSIGPDLTDDYWKLAKNNEEVFKLIKDGIPGTLMLGFKEFLKDEEIKEIMLYLSILQGQKKRQGKGPEGEKRQLLRNLYFNK